MSFFNSWSFSGKLMAVNASYILPCGVLMYFLILEKNNQIDFGQTERAGVEYQIPLQTLLTHVSEQKIMTREFLSGNKDIAGKLEDKKAQITRDFMTLTDVDGPHAQKLQFTTDSLAGKKKDKIGALSLNTEWTSISGQQDALTPALADERFDGLIGNINGGISYLGDSSNLILDPDLDSYYMMDATVIALPQAQTQAKDIVSYLQTLKAGEELSEKEKIKLNVLATQLQSMLDHVSASVQTSLSSDRSVNGPLPSMQKEIPAAINDYVRATDALIAATLAAASEPLTKEKLDGFVTTGGKAIAANFAFLSKASEQLDALLVVRVEAIKKARLVALGLALLAWLPTVLLAGVTVRRLNLSFTDSVSTLESEAAMASKSSANLSSASQTVSSGSTEQAAAIQETGASMSEMASMVSRSSTQAVTSQELSHKIKEQTEEGCRVMERMVHSMEAIQEANGQLQNISSIISYISEKTNIINDIVGKTQLLSFNASIEAARAGQHGRGFAVVAEEVGNLAQTSGSAAKEIRALIEDSRQQVEHILKSTLERVSEGKSVTEQAQKIFEVIAKDISRISSQIEGISEAAREQQFGIEQIAKAMTQMDSTTQANNRAAYSAASLSDQLMNQSQKLTTIASTLAELVSGKKNINVASPETSGDRDNHLTKPNGPLRALSSKTIESIVNRAPETNPAQDGMTPPPQIDADDDSFKRAV
jgi:methyl-accepting chemotaxis protein